MMTSAELREAFLQFFSERGHTRVPSSSLVPANDPSLLFTNAGMVQFKDIFLGQQTRPYPRAVSAQRCIRAGGKHNDLENVGYTLRHHTFFEMLGNFSFGDYFKQEAIIYAWDFLCNELKLDPQKLWVTVFEEDDESADIWLNEVGVSPKRFSRLGVEDNFWAMGDTGPCGPCSEIYYDHGADYPGEPPGGDENAGERYVEIWNLVFMQFERHANGDMQPLAQQSVDTGMGLERVAAVMQGVHSNYQTDILWHLIQATADQLGVKPDPSDSALRVIADHIRAAVFLIADGVFPANEGRGYVLRRIMRRAIRHAVSAGHEQPFMAALLEPLIDLMGSAAPHVVAQRQLVADTLQREEQQFAGTLKQGLALLQRELATLSTATIPGELIFRMYDTYGFPVELLNDVAKEQQLQMDMAGFEHCMQEQRQRARAASGFRSKSTLELSGVSKFIGYYKQHSEAQVVAILYNGQQVEALGAGQQGSVVLDKTPFYAEAGGQVGDSGIIAVTGGTFSVTDTIKSGAHILHVGTLSSGELQVGDRVVAEIDRDRRHDIALNHSATHLLHAALRQVLGDHVNQKGSLVAAERLRFDFSHPEPVNPEQLRNIEDMVNARIRQNSPTEIATMSLDDAMTAGAMALFGEKYDDQVRVLTMGEGFSIELCGGTHVQRSGDIGLFRIVTEGGVAAGIRRIDAVTSQVALEQYRHADGMLQRLAKQLKTVPEDIEQHLERLLNERKEQQKALRQLKEKNYHQTDWSKQAQKIGDVWLLIHHLEAADGNSLRELADNILGQLHPAVVVLASVNDGKVALVVKVSKALTKELSAGKLVAHLASQVGGKGGGQPGFAQGGGKDPEALPQALASVESWIQQHMPEKVS